ncbi:carbohydrate-binding module family 18 protein [Piromyces sp. E2]|nr:carbohydrate-binding module family 18 protein [Piromyces sp. E2]|eukprot:OUM61304.1 carbohydrate-binding module family 18 protein [Piromyces sp. E2]
MKCFDSDLSLKKCTKYDNKVGTNCKCGRGNGYCPGGFCCGKNGIYAYGTCTVNFISLDGRCGNKHGKCPKGQCCSKFGYCGISKTHCTISKGCQFDFGICKYDVVTSINGKCGPADDKCPKGECCNSYGYCDSSDRHCLISEGCQSEYGLCTTITLSNSGRCGTKDGRCPKGQCCSKYGWYGTGSNYCDYCGTGCLSNFGICE